MSCPNCRQNLDTRIVDDQTILYCLNCGGTFFEENGINRISLKSAQNLADRSDAVLSERSESKDLGLPKLCPKDQTVLTLITGEQSVPQNVNLFRCKTCLGIFAYPDDLINFKKAQNAKINFFAAWDLPPVSLRSVLVLTFVAVVSFAAFSGYFFLQQQTPSSAQGLIKNVDISSSARYLLISFRTQVPLKTKIIFVDRTINKTVELRVSNEFKTLHFISTSQVNIGNDVYYQIVGTDKQGREIKTDGARLTLE